PDLYHKNHSLARILLSSLITKTAVMKSSSTNFAKNPGAGLILKTSLAGLKRLGLLVLVIFALQACGEGGGEASDTTSGTGQTTSDGNPPYDPERGAGKFKDVQIPEKLDPQMA